MMDTMLSALRSGLPGLGVTIPEGADETLCKFGCELVEQNKVMNLTAITEPEAVAKLHLLDCLTVLKCADLKGKKLIDVGCGAGFPGVPLKIGCPGLDLTLLDSLGKRMNWLEATLPKLGVDATYVIDSTNNQTYIGTYKVSRKTVNSIDYEITINGIKGYATVAQTKYYDGSEEPTLPINLGNYALYFVPKD